MFYIVGSFLFAVAMIAAFWVMAGSVAHYRRAMMTALRGLSLDGYGEAPRAPRNVTLPAVRTAAARQAVA